MSIDKRERERERERCIAKAATRHCYQALLSNANDVDVVVVAARATATLIAIKVGQEDIRDQRQFSPPVRVTVEPTARQAVAWPTRVACPREV